MQHTQECLAYQEKVAMQREDWLNAHPNHCRACHGTGQLGHPEDAFTQPDTCPICVENGICPLCGRQAAFFNDLEERWECMSCSWKFGEYSGMPPSWEELVGECDCEILAKLEQPD